MDDLPFSLYSNKTSTTVEEEEVSDNISESSSTLKRGDGSLELSNRPVNSMNSSYPFTYLKDAGLVKYDELVDGLVGVNSFVLKICAYHVNTSCGSPFVEYVVKDKKYPSKEFEISDDETNVNNICYTTICDLLNINIKDRLPPLDRAREDQSFVKGYYKDDQHDCYIFIDLNHIPSVAKKSILDTAKTSVSWVTITELLNYSDYGLDKSVKLALDYVDKMGKLFMGDDNKKVYPLPKILYGDPLLVRRLDERLGYFFFLSEKKGEGLVPYVAVPPPLHDTISIQKGLNLKDIKEETLNKYDEIFCDSKAVIYKLEGIRHWCWKDASRILPRSYLSVEEMEKYLLGMVST
jgi:hypothetical protein